MPEQIAGSAAQAAYCQAVKRHSLAQLRQPDIAAAKKGLSGNDGFNKGGCDR